MIIHGYMPSGILETAIIPIIKNKKGDVTNSDNYRPIAITCVLSKIIELLILHKYSHMLTTTDNQFGFKEKHSTDMCVFAVQQMVDMYSSMNSPVYICYLDASKPFDRINHWSLFTKLLHRKFPKLLVRLIVFWYTVQQFVIQWGSSTSMPFTVSNGVRQGGILSPILFCLYMDNLSMKLLETKVGCNVNNVFINHMMYADDTAHIAPSPMALQILIDCCVSFAASNDIIFNQSKSKCMYIQSKKYKDLPQPEIYLQEQLMTFVDYEKYLGVVMSDNCTNDRDITRHMRSLYARGNLIIRNFKHCSNEVKIQLFKTFCSNMYCGHLWSSYFSYSYSKIRVAFKQIYRCLMKLDRRSSISQSMLIFDIDNFDIIIRKAVYNFRQRLMKSENTVIGAIINSMFFQCSTTLRRWYKILF